ncbi:MAG: hypothetical protein PHU71_06550 [Candidatus Gracilibacteria bacterium]|nr:hypothetical protein [Candidatus Gracilibacteria bacterium]
MIQKTLEIDGEVKNALVFGSMWEYLEYFGTTVEDYRLVPREFEGEQIVGKIYPIDDGYFHTSSRDQVEINGTCYQHVNWGEEEYSLIPELELMSGFWTIYDWMGDKFNGYESIGEIFRTKEDARRNIGRVI